LFALPEHVGQGGFWFRRIEMGTLIFICPGTRQTVSTGIEIDPASFSTLESDGLWEVHRPQCSETPPALANFCYPKRDGRSHLLSLLQDRGHRPLGDRICVSWARARRARHYQLGLYWCDARRLGREGRRRGYVRRCTRRQHPMTRTLRHRRPLTPNSLRKNSSLTF
jgi:hypothetical protein